MKKKVVVSLQGGLGNQLHQYAYGLLVAKRINAELFFDVEFLNNYSKKLNVTYRSYEINKFHESPKFYKSILSSFFLFRIIKKIRLLNFLLKLVKINVVTSYIPLNEVIIKGIDIVYIHGIMGMYEDYKDNEDFLKENIKFNSSFKELIVEAKSYVNYPESVSIHIRRTDYLKKGSIHHVLDMEYYNKAVKIISKKLSNPKFYIFSDDIEFVKQNFNLSSGDFYFLEYSVENAVLFDFVAIKECKHHIGANSTFSWWATFLADSHGISIVPSVNLTTETLNLQKSYPSHWIVI